MLLNSVLALHDVSDAERFCRRVLDNHLRKNQSHLDPTVYDDALTSLIGTAWELSVRFDPERSSSFSKYAYDILSRRVVDWFRTELGRTVWQFAGHTYQRERVETVSLNAHHGRDDGDSGELGDLVAGGHSSVQADSSASLQRLDSERNRDKPRDRAELCRWLYGEVAA